MVNGSAVEKYKLGALFVLILLSFAGLLFIIKHTSDLQKQMTLQRYELSSLRAEAGVLDKILADKETFEPKSSQVIKSLPANYQEVAYFVEEVEGMATASAIPVAMKIDQEAKEEESRLESVGFSLTSKGSYLSYNQILSLLANLPFHTKVATLKMEADGPEIASIIDFKVYIWEKEAEKNGEN